MGSRSRPRFEDVADGAGTVSGRAPLPETPRPRKPRIRQLRQSALRPLRRRGQRVAIRRHHPLLHLRRYAPPCRLNPSSQPLTAFRPGQARQPRQTLRTRRRNRITWFTGSACCSTVCNSRGSVSACNAKVTSNTGPPSCTCCARYSCVYLHVAALAGKAYRWSDIKYDRRDVEAVLKLRVSLPLEDGLEGRFIRMKRF